MLHVHQQRLAADVPLEAPERADLCLLLCPRDRADVALLQAVAQGFPGAVIVGATTAGQIQGDELVEDAPVLTAVRFDHSRVHSARADTRVLGAHEAGAALGRALDGPELKLVWVLSEGLRVNGSALARGLTSALPQGVVIGGGLSADGTRFASTMVCDADGWSQDTAVAVGFYGDRLMVGQGSLGGWGPFGPERLVTRSHGNTVFSLDDEPALDLYVRYLGPYAAELPAAALKFPLSVRTSEGPGLVRTALSVDEERGSVTYAGDVPQGSYARLMRANLDRLVDGAQGAAEAASILSTGPALALLVSCVGRRMVLGPRTVEELDAVAVALGPRATLAGFYSYGELGQAELDGPCALLNQTMTIATLAEL